MREAPQVSDETIRALFTSRFEEFYRELRSHEVAILVSQELGVTLRRVRVVISGIPERVLVRLQVLGSAPDEAREEVP